MWNVECHRCFLCAGAFLCERTGIIIFCIERTFVSTVLFAQFLPCRTLAAVFHYITVYKQPLPSLHRQHYLIYTHANTYTYLHCTFTEPRKPAQAYYKHSPLTTYVYFDFIRLHLIEHTAY